MLATYIIPSAPIEYREMSAIMTDPYPLCSEMPKPKLISRQEQRARRPFRGSNAYEDIALEDIDPNAISDQCRDILTRAMNLRATLPEDSDTIDKFDGEISSAIEQIYNHERQNPIPTQEAAADDRHRRMQRIVNQKKLDMICAPIYGYLSRVERARNRAYMQLLQKLQLHAAHADHCADHRSMTVVEEIPSDDIRDDAAAEIDPAQEID